ncbi:MAG: DUF1036 domain-containing protein [Pseudomonadota bacterium]
MNTKKLLFWTGFSCLLTPAYPAMAGSEPVRIENTSSETRKVCIHRPKKVIASRCFTIRGGRTATWYRRVGKLTHTNAFSVKVYQKRKLVDKFLYKRDLPHSTGKIIIGPGSRFGFSRVRNLTTKHVVRACNKQHDGKIWFVLGYDTPRMLGAEGWWGVEKGECTNIPVSENLKARWNVAYGDVPRIYFYARRYGDRPLYWEGGKQARPMCLDPDRRFGARFTRDGFCSNNLKSEMFRYLATPKDGQGTIYLNF